MEELPKELQSPRIEQYIHCSECLNGDDKERQKSSGLLAVGWTKEGLQIVCEDCNQNVLDLDFEGRKIKVI